MAEPKKDIFPSGRLARAEGLSILLNPFLPTPRNNSFSSNYLSQQAVMQCREGHMESPGSASLPSPAQSTGPWGLHQDLTHTPSCYPHKDPN